MARRIHGWFDKANTTANSTTKSPLYFITMHPIISIYLSISTCAAAFIEFSHHIPAYYTRHCGGSSKWRPHFSLMFPNDHFGRWPFFMVLVLTHPLWTLTNNDTHPKKKLGISLSKFYLWHLWVSLWGTGGPDGQLCPVL